MILGYIMTTNLEVILHKGKIWLENEYIIKRRSMSSIANELNVYPIDVSKALKYYNIVARSPSSGRDISDIDNSNKLLNDYDLLYDLYHTKQLSISYISNNIIHLPQYKIKEQLTSFAIPIRTYHEQLSISQTKRANTDENKDMISKRFLALWNENEEFKTKMKNRKFLKGEDHPRYGKKWTEEQKRVLIGRKGHPPGPTCKAFKSKGNWYNTTDGNIIWLRSTYETRTAIKLDQLGVQWFYEPKIFNICINGNNTTYRPDFYLPEYDIWWEVKGWFRDQAKTKIKNFNLQYPNELLYILFDEDIKKLELLPNFDEYAILNLGVLYNE